MQKLSQLSEHFKKTSLVTAVLKVRIGAHDSHYAGGLVDGAKMLQFFGDVATEILIRFDGDEGLFRAYECVEFLAPVYAGDFIEVEARLIRVGKTSRQMVFEARKMIQLLSSTDAKGHPPSSSAGVVLSPPLVVCRAVGTCVTPEHLQRIQHALSR